MTRKSSIPILFGVIFFTSLFIANTADSAGNIETKTKIRLEDKGVWLETEISPTALLSALPHLDINHDKQLDDHELSDGRTTILEYYDNRVTLECDSRQLRADSTYFAFRSPVTISSLPDRFFIYHWYAVLRKPKRLNIQNKLFFEIQDKPLHTGSLISEKTILTFNFFEMTDDNAKNVNSQIEFKFSNNGKPSIVKMDYDITQAGYVWIGVGLSGLLILRIAAAARTRRRRHFSDPYTEEEGSPVLS